VATLFLLLHGSIHSDAAKTPFPGKNEFLNPVFLENHAPLKLEASVVLPGQADERKHFRKEDRVAKVLQKHGDTPGLVHVFSAMEACQAFKPWHDKTTGKTGLRPTAGKCLHDYFYFLQPRLGLVYVRVPTWLPFRLQIYFNGHNWLASRLRRAGLKFQMADNALVECADWNKARALADDFSLDQLKRDLDGLARQCVPTLSAARKCCALCTTFLHKGTHDWKSSSLKGVEP